MTPDNFPLCRKLGLKLHWLEDGSAPFLAATAEDLEKILENAQDLYTRKELNVSWATIPLGNDTHKAKLLLIEEIKPCEHNAVSHWINIAPCNSTNGYWIAKCQKCGKNIEPTGWKLEGS